MDKSCLRLALLSACIELAASFSGPGYGACVTACIATVCSTASTAAASAGVSAGAAASTVAGIGSTAGALAGGGAAAGAGVAGAATAGAGAAVGAAAGVAGAAAVAVPAAAIAVTGAAGTAIAGCAAACLCFDKNVSVTGPDGPMPITDVKFGDQVLTLDDNGNPKFTSVLNTFKMHRDQQFEFVKIHTDAEAVSVTKTHPIMIKQDGENIVKEAGAVAVGDLMLQQGNATTSVARISTFTAPTKHLIQTHDGTLLADGLLVKTMGSNDLPEAMMAGRVQLGDVQAFVNEMDSNGDHALLSFEELAAPVLSQLAFKLADSNGDSKLDAGEVPEFLDQ